MNIRIFALIALLTLTGCASQVPALIKQPPDPDPELQQVKNNIESHRNQNVRWGGKIISVENKQDSSWIEILASPLGYYGEPGSGDNYQGRFIARVDGFLDPEHYSKDRWLTIYGNIENEIIKHIDDHPYSYPLVHTKAYYLWPEYQAVRYRQPYYYDDYFYSPYYFHSRYRYPYSYGYSFHHRYHRFGYGYFNHY